MIRRSGAPPSVEARRTAAPGLPEIVRWEPVGSRPTTAALVLAGSSGRVDVDRARVLAELGVTAETLRWFGGPGQPAAPVEVPLEPVLARVADLARAHARTVVVATSFGTELALLVARHAGTGAVAGVAAFAPSDVVWAGVREDGTQTSHWTLGGRPLPFLAFDETWTPVDDPPSYTDLYRCSRRRATEDAVAAARLPADVPELLLVTGGDDRVWPATEHAEQLVLRRRGAGLPTTHLHLAEAGHRAVLPGEPEVVAGQRMARGGTPVADRRLGAAAWPALQRLVLGAPPDGGAREG
ncbi:acyl-CoA thioester hydrolase/BAAT C-terminal domain-containing protein [Nocardioides sp.]|uniref:acyl-CoA thioester hydrolase/BAAT C-terminal domain-containing protein n=1 Tax=Nocardioides sp. TaxID=35761 RepID=UPI003512AAC4